MRCAVRRCHQTGGKRRERQALVHFAVVVDSHSEALAPLRVRRPLVFVAVQHKHVVGETGSGQPRLQLVANRSLANEFNHMLQQQKATARISDLKWRLSTKEKIKIFAIFFLLKK